MELRYWTFIATGHGLNFVAMQQRIHPADSRVRMLAKKPSASYAAFDLSPWTPTAWLMAATRASGVVGR